MTPPKYVQIQLSCQVQFTGPGLQDSSHPREMRTTLCCRVRHAHTAAILNLAYLSIWCRLVL
jgi:hypothetical protein